MNVKNALLRLSILLVAVTLAGAVLGGLPWTPPDVAVARKGIEGGRPAYKKYPGGKPKKCNHGCYVKKCKTGCGKAKRTCVYCAKQDGRERLNACSDAACKKQVKADVRTAAKACKGLTGQCGGCCKADYSGGCTDAFEGTSGFGGYFRTVKHYGKVHRYKPECDGGDVGGGEGCAATCERVAALGARKCQAKGRKAGTPEECTAAVEAQRQACLANCGVPVTTTTSTTTTIPVPGVP